MNQFVAERLLTPTNIDVTIAHNGQEAVELCRSQEFDIILMDIQMPVMGGLEATSHIRKLEGFADTPIIALTADIQDETRKKALATGMNDLLTKPFKSAELIDKLGSYLAIQA